MNPSFQRSLLVLAVSSVVALGTMACSPRTTSPTTSDSASQSSSAGGTSGVPKVANPKNLKAITDPCQLLTGQQLQELGATAAPRRAKSEWGEATCDWRTEDVSIRLAPDTTQDNGIAQAYKTKINFPNFTESNVDGYPAVRVDKQTLTCRVIVGVSDTQTLSVDVLVFRSTKPEYQDQCRFAEKVAGMVLSDLPASS